MNLPSVSGWRRGGGRRVSALRASVRKSSGIKYFDGSRLGLLYFDLLETRPWMNTLLKCFCLGFRVHLSETRSRRSIGCRCYAS